MKSPKHTFQETGFYILRNILSHEETNVIYETIQKNIELCAAELNCSINNYLRNVSRWVHPSIITASTHEKICPLIKKLMTNFFEEDVILSKMNIITKSAQARYPIPCHQDIAYSKENPYEFSVWLALHDVTYASGALEFLPYSHLEDIYPAIDFWDPNYVDKMYLSKRWQNNAITCTLNAGDAIIFDSRIWHRSGENTLGTERFAVVTRWSRKSYNPPLNIPDKIMAPFGLWTCGQKTAFLLKQSLLNYFQIESTADVLTDSELWIEQLNKQKTLPVRIDAIKAQRALENLSILHRASLLHNGGDAQGIVYPELWHNFLELLSRTLSYERTV